MRQLTAGQRSLVRYLTTFYFIWLGYFISVIMLLGGPTAAGANPKDLVWQIPVASAAMMGFQYRFALKTPEETRRDFWSYKVSNFAFAGILAITLVAVLTVDN
jgi:hypothetical protein